MRNDHEHDGARPWRGVKRDNWEGGHRVPFIARWPGKVSPGSRSEQTICLTDLMATCAAIVEADLYDSDEEDIADVAGRSVEEFRAAFRELRDHPGPISPFDLHKSKGRTRKELSTSITVSSF